MQFEICKESLKNTAPPATLSVQLTSMWYDARGDWQTAHHLVEHLEDISSCWVHAYLHRKEGDIWNADYWYSKANKKSPVENLEQEWNSIVQVLL